MCRPLAAALSALVISCHAYVLPLLESDNHPALYVNFQTKRHFVEHGSADFVFTPSILTRAVNATDNEIEAFFDPSALPDPWPLGLLSIIGSLATGHSNYKITLPEYKPRMQIGWSITLARSLALGVSSILKMHKGDYNGVSSDGFLALFANVVGLMAANRDHGKFWWAAGGVVGMLFGVCPSLARLSLALWKPNNESTFAPFRLSDGNRCIIDRSSYCNTDYPQSNVPYCQVPVLQKGGAENVLTFVDYVRVVAWLLAFGLCVSGVVRLFKKEGSKVFNRSVQVGITYLALMFTIALVLASAVIFSKGQRLQALDCRAATACIQSQPLPCPSITVFTPRSVDGFFKIWSKQLTGLDIPALLV